MPTLPRFVSAVALFFGLALAMPAIATLLFATLRHPECAMIPDSVGPCDYWGRVAEYGPFIMVAGTIVMAALEGAALALFAIGYGVRRIAR
ncbi:hypothetical protein [Nocardia sp. NPDC005978]|uniref:hypothetical protein n=1 Tax=unclassified Nocardia TaxID=2637762 RepID=UPI0033B19CFA